mgnify:CR=1 FL=1
MTPANLANLHPAGAQGVESFVRILAEFCRVTGKRPEDLTAEDMHAANDMATAAAWARRDEINAVVYAAARAA